MEHFHVKNGTVSQNFREEIAQYGKRLGMSELIHVLFWLRKTEVKILVKILNLLTSLVQYIIKHDE